MATPEPGFDAHGFPIDPDLFNADERISWSKVDNHHILVAASGLEYVFNPVLKRWIEEVDEDLIRQQQSGYKRADDSEDQVEHPREQKKRKLAQQDSAPRKAKEPRPNTAIWVTNIPRDADKQEIVEVFERKGGLIASEIDSGEPKVKMYNDDEGNFNGDALVVFYKPGSIRLAIQLLDEAHFRPGDPDPSGPIRVQEADPSFRAKKQEGTENVKRNKRDQQKIIERTREMDRRLADWGDDPTAITKTPPKEADKIVYLENMFTLKELEDEPAAILEIKEDIREECANYGEVTNVVLYDLEPEGVVSVRFKEPASARECVQKVQGRMFSAKPVKAYIAETRLRFRRSRVGGDGADDSADEDEEEQARLERFGDWLESRDTNADSNAKPKADGEAE